jgi:3',5'-cyclic AMP phosphodiesterase CpdA
MRLAHCSDLHLLSHDGARWLDLANKRWIGAMNLLSNRSRHYHVDAFDDMVSDLNASGVEHVLCTGDVTNLALRQEFEFARGKFDRLALGPLGVTVIPGNHDAYVAEGVPLFAELFAPFAASDPGWEWTEADAAPDETGEADDLRWPIVRVRGELALVGTSTSRATPWFTAYGRLGAGQVARLGRALADPRLAGKARVVAIHHPPAGKRARNRVRGLRDHAAFAAVIAETGADLIVHGHEHRDMTESLRGPAGPVPVRGIASGTFHAGRDKPDRVARYRIYEVGAGAMTETVRVWDRDRRAFVTEDLERAPAPDRGAAIAAADTIP